MLSETPLHRALIFGMQHQPVVVLLQFVFQIMALSLKWTYLGGHMFYEGLFNENIKSLDGWYVASPSLFK